MATTMQPAHSQDVHQQAQRLMQRATLRIAGIAALIVMLMLMGCAALPADEPSISDRGPLTALRLSLHGSLIDEDLL